MDKTAGWFNLKRTVCNWKLGQETEFARTGSSLVIPHNHYPFNQGYYYLDLMVFTFLSFFMLLLLKHASLGTIVKFCLLLKFNVNENIKCVFCVSLPLFKHYAFNIYPCCV